MKLFRCTVREKNGKITTDEVEAENQAQAVELLNAEDRLILSVIEAPSQKGKRRRGKKKVKTDQKVICIRQLATMVEAGLPLLQCLQTLEEQEEPGRFKEVLAAKTFLGVR